MNNYELLSEDSILVTYTKRDDYNRTTFFFNKELKCVDVESQRFIKNDEFTFVPQTENRYSSKYGYWQVESPCLSMKDIKFLNNKCKELWGDTE